MRFKIFFATALFFVFSLSTKAQEGERHYKKENGLPSNTIYHVIQDNNGFLWFCTDNGVAQFDGYNFKNFTTDDGLTDNEVFKAFQDSQNCIWFLTYNGKLCFYKNGIIYNETNTPFLKKQPQKSFFTKVIEASNGDLFFVKEKGKQLLKLSNEKFTSLEDSFKGEFPSLFTNGKKIFLVTYNFLNNLTAAYNLYEIHPTINLVDSLYSESKLFSVQYFNNHYSFFDKGPASTGKLRFHVGEKLSKTTEYSINEDLLNENTLMFHNTILNKKLYLSTSEGLFIFNADYTLDKKYLVGSVVTSAAVDFENGIWITTKNDGVYYFAAQSTSKIEQTVAPAIKFFQNQYNTNELWITGIGRYSIYNTQSSTTQNYQMPISLGKEEPVNSVAFFDSTNSIVASSVGVLLQKDKKQVITPLKAGVKDILIYNDSIFYARAMDISVQPKNLLFVGWVGHKPYLTHLNNKRTLCLYKAANGLIWVGASDGVYTLRNLKLHKEYLKINTRIKKIIQLQNGKMAFCSDADGAYIDTKDSLIHLTKKSGLLSDKCNNIHEDKYGNIWIASARGISKIANQTFRITNFSSAQGLADEQVNDIFFYNDSTHYLATSSGVYSFVHTHKQEIILPKINITTIKVNSNQINIEQLKTLNHNENNIEITYTGISYNSNKKIEYWYAFNSDSTNWKQSNSNTITFVNLEPGNYSLLLKCKNISGIWSNVVKLPIKIHNPFYKTTAFIVSVTLAFIFLIVLAFILYRRKLVKENIINHLISETQQKALRAQLNPHFIFNALSSIQYLFLSDKDNEAQEYLGKFSVMLRNTLNNSDKTLITLQEELDSIKLYMELEQNGHPGLFDFKIEVDEHINTNDIYVPSMFLQPIVENAIIHGIKPSKLKGEILVQIFNKDAIYFEIQISDNGIGYSKSRSMPSTTKKHKSKGTNLITDRINALNFRKGETAYFQITDLTEGTKVILTLPKQYKNV